jgi:hypothetical protein
MRRSICALSLLVLGGCATRQSTPFAGALAGIATLSADARAIVTGTTADASLYKPENGPAVNLLTGVHMNDYFSVQANYIWNRNTVTAASIRASDAGATFFEERRTSTQHAFIGDALLYFRNHESWARPYLSAGVGLVRLESSATVLLAIRGGPQRPPETFASTAPALRVAVGIDLGAARGWSFRYSFSETISRNAVSTRLSPPAQRNLANFQNLFGATRSF